MEFETNFAYICPYCFGVYGCRLNIFSLSGKRAHKFICAESDCRSECASIKKLSSNKYLIEVTCPFCGERHTQKLSTASIWDRASGTIRCPHAAADVFFYGCDSGALNELVNHTTDIFEQRFSNMSQCAAKLYSNPIITEILMNLERLMSDNQISCVCGCENIGFGLNGNSIALICRRCGRHKEIDISKENLLRLINASCIVLGN